MTLQAVMLLLCAQLAGASGPPAPAANDYATSQSLSSMASANYPPATFPSIDQAARYPELALVPFSREPTSTTPNEASGATLTQGANVPRNPFSLAGFATQSVLVEEPQLEANSLPTPPVIDSLLDSPLASPAYLQPLASSLKPAPSDYGLGYERVRYAPIATETALGVPSMGVKFRYNRGASSPDRLEYLWARAGKGPQAETGLDVLDTVFRTELGNARGVLISEISMRSLDPDRAPNTTGFGDMIVGGKTVIMDGACTKLSTIFLTYINTGPADRGLGTGHVSLEPGLLGLHQWSERTYLHGSINYRLPIAGTSGFAGDVLTTSSAISTIWRDRDDFAWIPVLEFQTHSFLFGSQTLPDGSVQRVNGTTALDIMPGSRWSFSRSALGAYELGLSGGFRCSDADWFDSRMMFDIRWLR